MTLFDRYVYLARSPSTPRALASAMRVSLEALGTAGGRDEDVRSVLADKLVANNAVMDEATLRAVEEVLGLGALGGEDEDVPGSDAKMNDVKTEKAALRAVEEVVGVVEEHKVVRGSDANQNDVEMEKAVRGSDAKLGMDEAALRAVDEVVGVIGENEVVRGSAAKQNDVGINEAALRAVKEAVRGSAPKQNDVIMGEAALRAVEEVLGVVNGEDEAVRGLAAKENNAGREGGVYEAEKDENTVRTEGNGGRDAWNDKNAIRDAFNSIAEDENAVTWVSVKMMDAKSMPGYKTTLDPADFEDVSVLVNGNRRVSIWRGDITKAPVDAIVNAANSAGLGCFIPRHRCVDNIIHRACGPRLREACRVEMATAVANGSTGLGSKPIVTKAFHIPAKCVFHVAGPELAKNKLPTTDDRARLVACYTESLNEAAKRGIKSIGFCCISTGLFGYPADDACRVAVTSVYNWFVAEPNGHSLENVCFIVFKRSDEALYRDLVPKIITKLSSQPAVVLKSRPVSVVSRLIKAKQWIKSADYILICAGAGMSIKPDSAEENVYTNEFHFAKLYPEMIRYGYKSAYQCISLFQDERVPWEAKWAFWAKHMNNMRYEFTPADSYELLKTVVYSQDLKTDERYFVLTSNTDGCFERAGFADNRVYRPQGDWEHYQCIEPCRRDAVFDSKPMLDDYLSGKSAVAPTCAFCKGPTFGNVRGGPWYSHHPQDENLKRFTTWVKFITQKCKTEGKTMVIVEIGAGFNTPTITRFLMEAITREHDVTRLIRVNPSDPKVPNDLSLNGRAIALESGWEILRDFGTLASLKLEEITGRPVDGDRTDDEVNNFVGVPWIDLARNLMGA